MKINGKIISEPKSKLTIKNDPYLTFKMKFNKNKWDIKFMSIVCFDSLAKEVKWNIDKNDLIRITLDKNFEITNETLFIKPNNIELYDLLWDCKYKEIYDLLIIYWSSICECFNEKRLRLLIDFANYLRSNMQGLYDLMLNDDEYYGNIAESYVSHLVKSKINKHYSIWSVNVAAMKILQNVENCGICVEIL